MRALFEAIPDVEVLLALEPEELGAKLLFLVRDQYGPAMFNPGSLENELWAGVIPSQATYSRQHQRAISLALAEAWSWLEAQGLVVPEEGMNRAKRLATVKQTRTKV